MGGGAAEPPPAPRRRARLLLREGAARLPGGAAPPAAAPPHLRARGGSAPTGCRGSPGGASAAGTDGSGIRGTARGHAGGARPEVTRGRAVPAGPARQSRTTPRSGQRPRQSCARAARGLPLRCGHRRALSAAGRGGCPALGLPLRRRCLRGFFSAVSWGLRLFFLFPGALSICLARSPHQRFGAWASPFRSSRNCSARRCCPLVFAGMG